MAIDLTILESAVRHTCTQKQWSWFCEKQALLTTSEKPLDDLAIILAMAKRKVGSGVLKEPPDITTNCSDSSNVISNNESKYSFLNRWSNDEAVRVLLLATVQHQDPNITKSMIETAFQHGDEYEREAILKGLSILDVDGVSVDLAVEACRSNIITLFSAISQSNSYPMQHFDEGAFNQMVLKSLFLDINIDTIIGLRERVNKSMSRMCYDYLREREAANRAVPASIWLTLNLKLVPQAQEAFIRYLTNEDAQHHYYLALSLSWHYAPSSLRAQLHQRVVEKPTLNIPTILKK